VDALADVLAAEDARRWDGDLFQSASNHADPVVRRHAALALGRIRNPAGVPILLELLTDPDSVVQQDAAFALGLIADPTALQHLQDVLLQSTDAERTDADAEIVTAIAKIGGPDAARLFDELLVRWMSRTDAGDTPFLVEPLLGEAWRLGEDAPVVTIAQLADAPSERVRRAAVYSLYRLRAAGAARELLAASADEDALVREWAARALTRAFADSAGLDHNAIATRLSQLAADQEPGVRVNALWALGTFANPDYAGVAVDGTGDPESQVRLQALATLGQLGGELAATALTVRLDDGSLAERGLALTSLARVDRGTALTESASWITNEDDWRRRAVGAQALQHIGGDTALSWLEQLVFDQDGRVAATAFDALARGDSGWARELAPQLLTHPDPVVRTLAARHIEYRPRVAALELLVAGYGLAEEDAIPDARIAIVEALGAISELGYREQMAVQSRFLARYPTCDDYLVRRAALESLPPAAMQWGPPEPVETGRDTEDYRDIARRLVLPAERGEGLPELYIETDRGTITVELFAADAPITVNALLQLADRHYFDGGAWHRVVPNFVIQDGDPRGDGWGGPGFALRDEINRNRYRRGTVGMALSGPDTGGSQFFITHAPQPHLDGTYTVFGRVRGGLTVVDRIVPGDRIRSVRWSR
jgi:cyclophilin family peptidyl-prolyl cis-trans isomerase/HEAT repeat protein